MFVQNISMSTIIKIALNKKKFLYQLMGALFFMVISVVLWIFSGGESFVLNGIMKLAAAMGIVFFGFAFIVIALKLIDVKPALIIDSAGIRDNSSFVSVSFIPWHEVMEMKFIDVKGNKFCLLFVQNPDKIINNETGIKKWLMKLNYNMYGTPVTIATNALLYQVTDLEELFNSFLFSGTEVE